MQLSPPEWTGGPRPLALFDTECFPNFWLLKLRPLSGGCYTLAIWDGMAFTSEHIQFIQVLFLSYTVVSFNGDWYDVPMLRGVICGYDTNQLKQLNDAMIVDKIRPWDLNIGEWKPADHIDLMQVAPGAGSQKQYAGRIHCKRMRDLPYTPDQVLSVAQMHEVAAYCENDLDVLGDLFKALQPQIRQRERLTLRYGVDVRSKSDAQVAEAVLRKRCEQATGQRIYKPRIDWGLRFCYKVPDFISFHTPQLQRALQLVKDSVFTIRPPASMRAVDDDDKGKCIGMPAQLEGLTIAIGSTAYKMGVGGLHSQEKRLVAVSNETHLLRMPDVASYYPNLMVNAGAWPQSLGPQFVPEFEGIKVERLQDKEKVKKLKAAGDTASATYQDAATGDAGGKIMINGTFGKTGNPFSCLWAPEMLIQTTLTGQLALLMLIEWHECYGIPVVSANTDGLVIYCPRDKLAVSEQLIAEWERRTGLKMDNADYLALYAKDVNNYFAVKSVDDVKRKGEYATSGLVEKKNPDVEICADAVAEYLAKGVPVEQTIYACRDIRKFVSVQKVDGGAVKMWGDGPRKDQKVSEMIPTLERYGWQKAGRKWMKDGLTMSAADAHAACYAPRRPEYLGKVIRWYYGTDSPGPILYASNGNTVGSSYGAHPCMTLPDELPANIDHQWYVARAQRMLRDIGHSN